MQSSDVSWWRAVIATRTIVLIIITGVEHRVEHRASNASWSFLIASDRRRSSFPGTVPLFPTSNNTCSQLCNEINNEKLCFRSAASLNHNTPKLHYKCAITILSPQYLARRNNWQPCHWTQSGCVRLFTFFLRINPAASSRVAATADWNSGRPRIMKWPRRASSSAAPADSDPGTDWGYVRPGWAHAITGDRRWSPGDYVDSCSFHRPSSTSPRGDPSKLLGLASGGAASQVEDFGWAVIYLFCAFAARWRARL